MSVEINYLASLCLTSEWGLLGKAQGDCERPSPGLSIHAVVFECTMFDARTTTQIANQD